MRTNEPIIRPLPTEYEIRQMVDTLVTPEEADVQARTLAKLLLTVSDADNDDLHHLAVTAAKHGFTKTSAFQEAFETFADLPSSTRPGLPGESEREVPSIEIEKEQ